ncbi:ATP-grasp domain-containing protein [Streptomyces avicenniae]|uniref:ATP-grasp domain-containing protein n=1 Tax=Streptomyces avicenniae TaxID=500153 RepID=UPI000DA62695|nr:ATP-grasp domain-containing protein [Streptomyces avicenniae]
MKVRAVPGPALPEGLAGRSVHWYGGPYAADRVADRLGLALLEPPDDWLTRLPHEFTGRRIERMTLAGARTARGPVFVKPPSDKSFPAAVYADGSRLPQGTDATTVLVSDVVAFAAEYRLFLLDGRIAAASRYAVHGRLDAAPLADDPCEGDVRRFARRLLDVAGAALPSAVTVDVGLLADDTGGTGGGTRWAAVEANMAWFSHSYACEPDAVLDVVLRATGPRARVTPRDRPFLRAPAGPSTDRWTAGSTG